MPTQRLWQELGAPGRLSAAPKSTDSRLGDWALKSVELPLGRCVVAVNESTLMCVAFPWVPLSELVPTMADAVGAQLERFGVSRAEVSAEVEALRSAVFGKGRSRSLVGILNEIVHQLEYTAEDGRLMRERQLEAMHRELNEIPHFAGTASCVFADRAVAALFARHRDEM